MKNLKSLLIHSILFCITLFLAACGSSGSSNNNNDNVQTTTITGSVFAAPVSGATVVVKDAAGSTVGSTQTGPDGTYSIDVPSTTLAADMRVEANSGTYTDEATGSATTAGTLAAYVSSATLTPGIVNIDPSSTIIYTLVTAHGKTLADAEAAFNSAFGYIPDITVAPKNSASSGSDDAAQRLAGFRAGVFSQLTMDLVGNHPEKQFELLAAIAQDLADDAVLNGSAGTVNGAALPEDIGNKFECAFMTFMASSANQTGLSADEIGTMPFSKVALSNNYRVEYIPGTMSAAQGKTTFTLSITSRGTGSVHTASDVTLMPMMHMASHEHSTPVGDIQNNGDGTYTCTVYYLMSSSMSGMSMGYWSLEVMIGMSDSVAFYPSVGMSMSSDTVLAKLKGVNDIVSTMSGTSNRSYYLFNDGLQTGMMAGSGTLNLFIAANDYDNMMGTYPALSSGATETTALHDGNNGNAAWNAYPVTVEACLSTADCTSAANWVAASNTGGGGWQVNFSSGVTSGVSGSVYVRLLVGKDGGAQEQKTTNGMAYDGSTGYDGTNGYQTFTVTPGSMSM
jgi:hypothetical protein